MSYSISHNFKCNLIKIVLCLLVCFCSFKALASDKNTISQKKRDTILVTNKNQFVFVPAKEAKVSGIDWQKNMPWIAALVIGILTTAVNFLISRNLRRTSLETTNKQLENATKLAVAQMAISKENNERDFNKTVLSGNMQIWSNNFRDIIIKILSSTSSFKVKRIVSDDAFDELRNQLIGAELMLNPEKDVDFISALQNLQECCLLIKMDNQTVDDLEVHVNAIKLLTQNKLKSVWEKVKSGI